MILHFVFNVNVSSSSSGDDEQPFPTGNPELDAAILPGLINDRINFKRSVSFDLEAFAYQFNQETNQIEIWVRGDHDIDPEQLAEVLDLIDPDEGGPDGWMEGDISIIDDEVAQQFGYERLELWPRIAYVGQLIQEPGPRTYSEYEVDLSALPKVSLF